MKCNKCKFDNPKENIFCSKCGTRLSVICPKCDFINSPDNQFCGGCGTKLKSNIVEKIPHKMPALPDTLARKIESQTKKYKSSRRNVTVVFADISGFTTMSEKLDPEEVTEKMNMVFQKLSDVIYNYQGYIDKFIGDCVMILFGAPISHENDPLRAVLCSIDMLKAMNELNKQLLQEAKEKGNIENIEFSNENELNLSIGINYGKVVAGEVGSDQKMDYTVMGDTVNLASRLESIAGKGEIYVSEKTYNETKSEIEYKKLDAIKVKGIERKLIPYKPISVKTRYMTRRIREIPMIGREKEINKLLGLYKKANSNRGQIVSIIADAGVGKSKLFYEFQKQIVVNETSHQFLEGKCIDYLRNSDYFALKQILRKLIGFEERSGIEEISNKIENYIKSLKDKSFISIIPYLEYLFSSQISDAEKEKIELLKSEEKNYIFNRLVCLLFRKLSENIPLIIVFDDIHWSDKATMDFILMLSKQIEQSSIMIVLLFRPDAEINDIVKDASEQDNCEQLELTSLDEEYGIEFIKKLLECDNIDLTLKELILKRSEGNPFYIEELTSLLLNGDMVEIKNNLARLKKGYAKEENKIPLKLSELIMSKVDKLDSDLKKIIQAASVIGKEFSTKLLEDIIEFKTKLHSGLESVEKKDLIRKITEDIEMILKGDDEYAFKHIIIKETVYESILRAERKIYHNLTGNTIEKLYKDNLIDYLDILIHHYRYGENNEKLLPLLLQLGDKTNKSGDYKKAEALYSEYIQKDKTVTGGMIARDYLETSIKLAGVKKSLAKYDEGLEILSQIKNTNTIDSMPDISARVYLQRSRILLSKGEYNEALEIGLNAKDIIEKLIEPDNELMGNIYNNIGFVYCRKGEYDKSLEYNSKSLEIRLKTLGEEHPGVATSYNNIGNAYQDKGEYNKAYEYYNKSLLIRLKTLGEEHPDVASSYHNIGNLYNDKGEYDKALEYYNKSLAICLNVFGDGHPDVALALNNLGNVYAEKGDFDSALEYHHKSLATRLKILGEEHPDLAGSYNNIGNIYYFKDDYDKALEYYRKSLAIWLRVLGKEHPAVALSYNNIGSVYHDKGDHDDALEYYNKSLVIWLKVLGKEHPDVALSYHNIGLVFHDKGEYDKAFEYINKSFEMRLKILGEEHLSIAESYTAFGNVLFEKGENQKSIEYYDKALNIMNRKQDKDHLDTAVVKFYKAKVLLATKQKEEALKYVKQAINIGKKHKIHWLKNAENLLTEIKKIS